MAEAIAVFVKVATWVFTSKTLAAVVVRTVVLAGMSALSSKLAARNAAKGNTAAAGVEQQRQGGGLVRRAIPLGPCVVFGSELALLASGNGDDNRTNWRALAAADWPCRAGRIWVNGQPLTFAGDINAGWQACDQYRAKNGQPRLWMRFLTGDWNQAVDSELAATGAFGADDKLRGVSALLIKRQYDADAFPNGAPDNNDLRIEVMDAPVYDWRDPTQSLTDVTTWKPSTNPVVLAENILCLLRAPAQFNPGTTAPIVGPGLKWERRGGRSAFRAQLTAYANLCDALVGGVPRYRAALVVRSDQTGEEVMQLLADACGGDWISGPAGGMLVPGHVPAPCRTIPVGEYVDQGAITFDPFEAPDQAFNTYNITGPDLDRAGELDTMTVVDADDVAADGGERAKPLDLSAVPWAEQRWRVGWRKYRLGRMSERRQIPVRPRHRDLIPGDVIVAPDATLPATPVDISAAWWQVTGAQESVREDGHWVALQLQRIDASVDGPVPPMGSVADFDPPPLAPELAVPTVSVVADVLRAGGAITPRWRLSLAPDAVQARARVSLQGPATTEGAVAASAIQVLDVARGASVWVASGPGWWRWRSAGVDANGRQGPWGSWSAPVQELQAVVAGSYAPQPVNLLPGAGPFIVPGDPGVGWLGPPGERWEIVESDAALLGQSMWRRPLDGAVWDDLVSPLMTVGAGETISATATLGRLGTWTEGDVGAAILYFDEGGEPVGAPEVIGWALDGTAVGSGAFEVTREGLVTPAGTAGLRFSLGVARGAGSGFAAGWRFKINRGPVSAPWTDEATVAWMWRSRIGVNVLNPDGGISTPDQLLNDRVPRIEGLPSTTVQGDFRGVPLPGQLPRALTIRLLRGAEDISALASWSVTTVGCTATVTGGSVTITDVAGNGSIAVQAAFSGVPYQHRIEVVKISAAPPVTGGGGATTAVDTSLEPTNSTALFSVSNVLTVRAGAAGQIVFSAASAFTTMAAVSTSCAMRIRYRAVGSGTWLWAAAEVSSTVSARGGTEPELGEIDASATLTGLVSGTDYQVELQARAASGATVFFQGLFAAEAS